MQLTQVRLNELAVDPASPTFSEDVVATIERFGVSYSPGWLSGAELERVRAEFDGAFANPDGTLEKLTDRGKDMSSRYGETTTGEHLKYDNNRELSGLLPGTQGLFNLPVLREVADGYLGRPNSLNRHIILTNDYRAGDEIISYHFDEIGALKFL